MWWRGIKQFVTNHFIIKRMRIIQAVKYLNINKIYQADIELRRIKNKIKIRKAEWWEYCKIKGNKKNKRRGTYLGNKTQNIGTVYDMNVDFLWSILIATKDESLKQSKVIVEYFFSGQFHKIKQKQKQTRNIKK